MRRQHAYLPFALILFACSSSDSGGTSADTGGDTGSIGPFDATGDGTADSAIDATSDSGSDATTDSAPDSTSGDTGTTDSATDDTGLPDTTSADTGTTDTGSDTSGPPATVFRVHYPASGHTLAIRGSLAPLGWDKGATMSSGGDDTWTWSATGLSTAIECKPLLDDATWAIGPNYKIEPGTTVDIYPHFKNHAGKYEVRWPKFHSPTLANDRGVWVYYPPTYLENSRAKFPVIYMHDGQNLFDAATAFGGNEWKVDETLDAASENGTIREAIVVGIENTAGRMYEYTPTKDPDYTDGGGGDEYIKLITDELKPVVESELPTKPARTDTVIIGSSLGGLISSYAGTKRADVFGLVGVMSPSTWWDALFIVGAVKATKGTDPLPLRVYVDSGDSGPSADDMADTKLLSDAYKEVGFKDGSTFKYVVQAGAEHNEYYWAQRLPGALEFLLGPREALGSMP